MIYKVKLTDDTIGTVCSDTIEEQSIENFMNEFINIHLYDDNGQDVDHSGVLKKILETIY